MSQIVKARIDMDGSIHLLESVRLAQPIEVDVALPEEAVIKPEQNTSASTVSNETRTKRAAWLKANRERYGGQFVALDGDELVALGRTLREAREAARATGKSDVFVTYLTKPDEMVEIGGWL